MTELSSHIAYLLRHHDCVVMPGIGAFVAVSREAEFSAGEDLAIPPRREISFNGAITSDDGLLSWSFSRRGGISYEQAASVLSAQIAEAARRLSVEGALHISRVGTLTRHRDGRVSFTPESPRRQHPALPQLRLKRFEPAPLIALHIEHRSQERTVAVVKVPLHRRMLAAAASAAILLGLGFTLSTPISVQTAHTASIASMQFTAPAVTAVDPLPVPADLQLCMAMPAEGPLARPAAPELRQPARYVLVVASLPTRALAEEFIRHSGDPRLKILDKDGKFRIYITDGTTQSDVSEKAAAIADLNQVYPDAWVCRK